MGPGRPGRGGPMPPQNNTNRGDSFPYSGFGGSYGSIGGGGPMYSRNNLGPLVLDHPPAHGPNNNGFKYSTLGGRGGYNNSMGGNQPPVNRWGASHPQQQQYRHQEYMGNSYNQDQRPAYMHNNNNSNNNAPGHRQQPPQKQLSQKPPPPPPLPEEYHRTQTKNTRWGNNPNRGESSMTSASSSAPASNISVLKELRQEEPKPKPPLPPPAASIPPSRTSKDSKMKEPPPKTEAKATDSAVDAMNALSNLENRWSVGAPKGQKRKRKRNRNRSRKNKIDANDGNASNDSVIIKDAQESGKNEWIDVEEGGDALSTKKLKVDIDDNGPPPKREEFDLVSLSSNPNDDFPPLPSKSRGYDLEAARLVSLEGEMSTSQLKSYASVLEGALDRINEASENRASQPEEEEEMDISEDEEEVEIYNTELKSKEAIPPKRVASRKEVPEENVVDLTYDEPAVDLTQASGADASTSAVPLPITENGKQQQQQSPTQQDLEQMEKEKRALKLAELRAKAKLARAKLRIAEQKKARGNLAGKSSSNDSNQKEFNNTRNASLSPVPFKMSPVPTQLRRITMVGLVIEDVADTGHDNEVRYVDSVYNQPLYNNDEQEDPVSNVTLSTTRLKTYASEEKRKKSEALKQKLELAKLQLEMKKKLLKKKKALSLANNEKDQLSRTAENSSKEQSQDAPENKMVKPDGGNAEGEREEDNSVNADGDPSEKENNAGESLDETPSSIDQTQAKLEQLRRRQKELKQKNEIANLRNIIHRQRDLLQAQGQELTESSTQLQSCVDGINSKQALLDESEKRLVELNHRKRIVEGMVLRATEQLMVARKALSERR